MKKFLLFLLMGLFASSLFARELDYNYLADSDEAIIYPMVWKNTVANEASLSGITRPQDGEVKKATDTGYWFQYSANTGLWVKIDKKYLIIMHVFSSYIE